MDTKLRIIFGFLLFTNTLLILFMASFMLQVRSDVTELRNVLATKEDVLNLTTAPQSDILDKSCTHCHAENKFSSFHGTEDEMIAMIARMQTQNNSQIDPRDSDAIHASLELLQCTSCHEERTTRKLALKTAVDQKEVIRGMLVKAGASADQEKIDRIQKSYQQLLGF
jgi:hypothetical protein